MILPDLSNFDVIARKTISRYLPVILQEISKYFLTKVSRLPKFRELTDESKLVKPGYLYIKTKNQNTITLLTSLIKALLAYYAGYLSKYMVNYITNRTIKSLDLYETNYSCANLLERVLYRRKPNKFVNNDITSKKSKLQAGYDIPPTTIGGALPGPGAFGGIIVGGIMRHS